ncbi:MAG: MBL fold metallo-hydrolase [Chloroflexota bacterium]|nr:MBL fold metallo-hydrolase [Chloroflexota bacterium]
MPTLHLLGTGASISDPHRTTTMLAFESDESVVVVDCGGDVVHRLMEAGVSLERIEALIITHAHADHVGGFPLFVQKMWLAGRRQPIPVYGIQPALDVARHLFDQFDTTGWEGIPEREWHTVPLEENASVLENEQWRITASPGEHSIPVIGLRVEDKQEGGVVAYSCDTERTPAITRLSQDADILVHEATGGFSGHTSAEGAAHVASEANAKRLLLVHLPPTEKLGEAQMAAARKIFADTEKGEEMGQYDF